MATTINGNYYAITTERVEEAEGVFNVVFGDRAKSAGASVTIEVTESAGEITINLPSLETIEGYTTPILIRDAGGFIADGTIVNIQPYTDGVDYFDFIQQNTSETISLEEAGSGQLLSWSASVANDLGEIQRYWNATIQKISS